MKCPIRNSFEDLNAMRTYFKGLSSFGSPATVDRKTWMLADFFQIWQVLNDPNQFKAYDFRDKLKQLAELDPVKYEFSSVIEASSAWLIFMEGERHLSFKRKLKTAMYGQDLDAVIREYTDQALQELEGRTTFDLMTDFCDPLITRIICVMLGIDGRYYHLLREIVKPVVYAFEPFIGLDGLRSIGKAYEELKEFFSNTEPSVLLPEGGILHKLSPQEGDNGMPEALSIIEFLILAGVETSVIVFCESIYRLMTDLKHEVPGLYQEDRRKIMIEELIRMCSAASIIHRTVQTDITMEGNSIKAGDTLWLSLASANRDPRYFPHPDIIHPDNMEHKHLAFGSGKHYCLGTTFLTREMQIILPAFFSRFGSRCRIPENEQPVISQRYFLPGIEKLTIQVNEP